MWGNYTPTQLLSRFSPVITVFLIAKTISAAAKIDTNYCMCVLNDGGQILQKPLLIIKKKLLSEDSNIKDCSHTDVNKVLRLMRDGIMNTDFNSNEIIILLRDLCTQYWKQHIVSTYISLINCFKYCNVTCYLHHFTI